jgi:agmatine/peptidylarginine deiminase
MEGGGVKENDGGGEFNYIIRTFVNVTRYPHYDNKKINKNLKKGKLLFLNSPQKTWFRNGCRFLINMKFGQFGRQR